MKHRKLLFAIISILILIRIIAAAQISTFYIDEHRRADTIAAFLTPDTPIPFDTFNIGPIPIFVHTDHGFSSILFLLPASIWSFFFGTSPTSLRVFMSIITTLAILLLSHALSLWYKNKKQQQTTFVTAAIIGLTLPWSFLQGMHFWDTTLAPVCFIIAFWAFTRLLHKKPHRTLTLTLPLTALPLSLIASTYLYLPAAIPAIPAFFFSLIYLTKKQILNPKTTLAVLAGSILICIPLLIFLLTGEDSLHRANQLLVFSEHNFPTAILITLQNLLSLISPAFLFLLGDPNIRHSTHFFGILGPHSIIPLLYLACYSLRRKLKLQKPDKQLAIISISAIALSFLSSALTVDSPPHSLRANISWVFFIILITTGITLLLRNSPTSKTAKILTAATSITLVIFFIAYIAHFFTIYVPASPEFFVTW